MLFIGNNKRTNFMSSSIILYLTFLCLLIICIIKYSCAESKCPHEGDEQDGVLSSTSTIETRSRRTRGRRSSMPKTKTSKFSKIPRVAVFQADGVFWPYKVENDIVGPFSVTRKDLLPIQMEENNMKTPMNVKVVNTHKCEQEITDRKGKLVKAYDGVRDILQAVKKKGSLLGLMETTVEGATLLHLVQLCQLDFFKFKEVDDDLEIDHIKRIQKRAEVDFKDMTYFGTNKTTLQQIRDLGITTVAINIDEGLKMHHIEEANTLYAKLHQ